MTTEFNPTKYKALAFDIYATLIDWETGIYASFLPILNQLPTSSPNHPSQKTELQNKKFIVSVCNKHEHIIQKEHPTLPYPEVLEQVYTQVCESLSLSSTQSAAEDFGKTIGSWPAFSDTVAAMQKLGKYYKLIVLSNVDRESFSRTLSGPLNGVKFDAIFTAQDIGSYKPDLKNFEYLIKGAKEKFGAEKDEIWMVANSLMHDHIPAKIIHLQPGVWIQRNSELRLEDVKDQVTLAGVFPTLADFAESVEKVFEKK